MAPKTAPILINLFSFSSLEGKLRKDHKPTAPLRRIQMSETEDKSFFERAKDAVADFAEKAEDFLEEREFHVDARMASAADLPSSIASSMPP